MAAQSRPLGSADSLRFFTRIRKVFGWLAVGAAVATFFVLFRDASSALVPALLLVLLYGIWLFLTLVERREALRFDEGPSSEAIREVAVERAEFRMAIGIGAVLIAAVVLLAGVLLGSKWLGTIALLVFLYLLVIGGPFWLAEILAAGEDARRRSR